MEILVFKFERPISNNKENKDFVPPPPSKQFSTITRQDFEFRSRELD